MTIDDTPEDTEADPELELEFEGEPVLEVENKVKATKLLPGGARHRGDRVVMVLEAELDNVAHEANGTGVRRLQRWDVLAAYALEEDAGAELLRRERTRYRLASDAAAGRTELPFDDSEVPAQFTTAGGVMMLPAEVAAQRGETWDPERLLSVEFADGSKALWPDDWEGTGQSLTVAGGMMRPPTLEAGERLQVVRLLDAESGEVVSHWTENDEENRLKALELTASFEEDREAVDELEAARRRKADEEAHDAEEDAARYDEDPEEDLTPGEPVNPLEEPERYAGTPWPGFANEKVSSIKNRILTLGLEDLELLAHVDACERRTNNRPSILKAVASRIDDVTAPPDADDPLEEPASDLGLELTIDGEEP